ncbi:MAG: hypothetical protein JSR91_28480 [Proteobacteria bacterium]|nr:hypothetical protein [Pseudomonadota bacterium]
MKIVRREGINVLSATLRALAVISFLGATAARAEMPAPQSLVAWKLEPNAKPAHYAVVEPSRTDLNIANVVLACESAGDRGILQLQLYLRDDGPLLPVNAAPSQLKDEPRAEIAIDSRIFPASLLFSDDHAVLADGQVENIASVSDALIDAMAAGRTMTLRFDLLAEPSGAPAAFDGEAVVDLSGGNGRAAVEAVRHCAASASDRTVGLGR